MTDVVMPQMGESIVEGTLTKWLKKPGERVERDELLFEISTDKVDTEIPSPVAGVLAQVLVEEGQTVAINTVVGRIDEGGVAVAATPAPEPEAVSEPVPAPAPVVVETPAPAEESAGPISPLVRRMARDHSIDLRLVRGTGMGGRITKQDVEAHLAKAPAPREAGAKVRIEPMSVMRQRIAEHMLASKRTSAHVTTFHRVDMTRVVRLRARVKEDFQARHGFALTYLPFIARAAAEALRAYPLLNASIDGANIVYHNQIDIGVAVALEGGYGLIVPVIRNADEKNVVGLQRAIVDLATRARTKQLKPDEVQGGTFSITNFGSFGSLFATPVINQPQVAILGVGAVEKIPVVIEDDAIAIRSVCILGLSFDHRLIDGALADLFCQKVKAILETWSEDVL
ncbi:MAG: dihydrolipoamide acetyltransferase family protein [Bryobacterales bacterium]|nr:dihydrolipoamide acetyltransferase family protein [Bryobacterales bacterium]